MIGKLKGYEVVIVMFEIMSVERRDLMKVYGVNLVFIDGKVGMVGFIEKVNEFLKENLNYKSLK